MKQRLKNMYIKNKRVILRCDFNVPISNGNVIDETKIFKILKTINYLINENPKEYYIPTDMLNYIKMAINLLEEESFTFLDIEISVDGNLKLIDAHKIAELVHDKLEKKDENIKHCMIHVNPYEKQE